MTLKALDDRALGHVAEYFRALSEPLRLKILNALRDHSRNVGQLTDLLGSSQANVSKHLATLTRLRPADLPAVRPGVRADGATIRQPGADAERTGCAGAPCCALGAQFLIAGAAAER